MSGNGNYFTRLLFVLLVLAVATGTIAAGSGIGRSPAPDPPQISHGDAQNLDAPPSDRPAQAAAPTTEWMLHKTADNQHPDNNEQQMVWLMNRARSNPTQEGIWLATSDDPAIAGGRTFYEVDTAVLQAEFASYDAKPPAAFDRRLYQAAKAHSDDLISRDAQDHDGQIQRVIDAGFSFTSYRGNVFAYAGSALNAHAAFNIDWGPGTDDGMQTSRGHRKAIMSLDGDYTNVGLAVVPESDAGTNVGPLVVTGNYVGAGNAADHYNRFIVGTVWQDNNSNQMYDPGEGIGGVTVMPDKGTYYAVTAASGGYAIPITAPGSYTVTFSGAASGQQNVTVGSDSVLLDLNVSPFVLDEFVYLPALMK